MIWSWPYDTAPEVRSFRLRAFNLFSISSQTQEFVPGGLLVQRFEARLTFPALTADRWRELDGLLAVLAGAGGKLRLWDEARKQPYYNSLVSKSGSNWDDNTTWDDGAQWESGLLPPFVTASEDQPRGATDLLAGGFPANTEGVLRRGDLFEVRPNGTAAEHGHLYVVVGFANSNSGGKTRIFFRPGLRAGVRAGDMLVIGGSSPTFWPSTVFRLASDDEGDIEVRAPSTGSIGVTLLEVLPLGFQPNS